MLRQIGWDDQAEGWNSDIPTAADRILLDMAY